MLWISSSSLLQKDLIGHSEEILQIVVCPLRRHLEFFLNILGRLGDKFILEN
jgi:hypothetical protein